MAHGFMKDEEKKNKELKQVEEISLVLPIKENDCCQYCDNLRIDREILRIFDKKVCSDCRFEKLELITKTHVVTQFLLNNDDIADLKYLSRPNPKKGTWNDMQLYDLGQIKTRSIDKFGSLENLETEKEERKEKLLDRKKHKIKSRIKELRKKTLIEDKMKNRNHKHNFVLENGISKCECGMIIESEEI